MTRAVRLAKNSAYLLSADVDLSIGWGQSRLLQVARAITYTDLRRTTRNDAHYHPATEGEGVATEGEGGSYRGGQLQRGEKAMTVKGQLLRGGGAK